MTKPIQHYPPNPRHVATLPWEIKKKSSFLQIWKKCKQIACKSTNFNSFTCVTVYANCIYVLTEYMKCLNIRRHSYFLR